MAGTTPFRNAAGESYVQNYDFTPYAYTRTLPVQDWLQEAISSAVYAVDPELQIRVTSGGQTTSRDPALKGAPNGWTGSTRHDGGNAADFSLVRGGEKLPINGNEGIYQSVARNLAAQGVPGIGVDIAAGYIHAGGGSQAAWGYQGNKNGAQYLPASFAEAINEGRGLFSSGMGIPTPAGMIPNPPGASVATALSTDQPATRPPPVPATISPNMATLRSGSSPDGYQITNPNQAQSFYGGMYTRPNQPPPPLPRPRPNGSLPTVPSPRVQGGNSADSLALNPVTNAPLQSFDAMYDTRLGSMQRVRPYESYGTGAGYSPAPPPIPAQMSPHLAAQRATDPVLQAAMDARYPPRPQVPGFSYAGLDRFPPPVGAPAAFGPRVHVASVGMPPLPMPRPNFQRPQAPQPRTMPPIPRPRPQRQQPTQRPPLEVLVQGSNTVQQAPQQQQSRSLVQQLRDFGLSPSYAYEAANAASASRAIDNASERYQNPDALWRREW